MKCFLLNLVQHLLISFWAQEYVEMFADPYHLDLESEKVWPVDKLVNY